MRKRVPLSTSAAKQATASTKPGTPGAPAPAPAKMSSRFEWGNGAASFFDHTVMPLLIVLLTPPLVLVLAYITMLTPSTISEFVTQCTSRGASAVVADVLAATSPTFESCAILVAFCLVALLLFKLPGPTYNGPLTANGALPEYKDNGIAHCVLSTLIFLGGSKELGVGCYKLSVLYDVFPPLLGTMNIAGLVFCAFLYFKGLHFPSGPDSGSSGKSTLFDYYWGTELYPRILGIDVKMYVNCRISMTFWQLAGISFLAASFNKHGVVDPGIALCALSQYLYLVKFYVWESGYMRSIDIIVDRAGHYETWGCLAWVPSVYTLHTRTAVTTMSGLSWPMALAIFSCGLIGVTLNFWADDQRQRFRESAGRCLVWGRSPVYIEAQYSAYNGATGSIEKHTSLLLASGWWGLARHPQYAFELCAAYSWAMLAGLPTHGALPLLYPVFLTILLVHRAHRDEQKCRAKYGQSYDKYAELVPYSIVPFVY